MKAVERFLIFQIVYISVLYEISVLYQKKERRTEIAVHKADLRTSIRELRTGLRYDEKMNKMRCNGDIN